MARETARLGVTANIVCPGPTDTEMLQDVAAAHPDADKVLERLARAVPMKRLGQPDRRGLGGALLRQRAGELHHRPDAVGQRRPHHGLSAGAMPPDRGRRPPARALVTGAAREGGIGAAIAERLQAGGYEVVTLDVEPGCTYQVDLVSGALPRLDDIDVLVSNAGVPTIFGAAHSMDLDRWRRDLDVNLTGSFRVVQACLPGCASAASGGSSSSPASPPCSGCRPRSPTAPARPGCWGWSRRSPPRTPPTASPPTPSSPGWWPARACWPCPGRFSIPGLQQIPTGRLVATEEIAEAVAFFASRDTGSVTGQELMIDGGQTLNTMSVTGSVVRQRRTDP